jgi:hypothetical protein
VQLKWVAAAGVAGFVLSSILNKKSGASGRQHSPAPSASAAAPESAAQEPAPQVRVPEPAPDNSLKGHVVAVRNEAAVSAVTAPAKRDADSVEIGSFSAGGVLFKDRVKVLAINGTSALCSMLDACPNSCLTRPSCIA